MLNTTPNNMIKRWLLLISTTSIILAIDQITKRWVVDNLLLGETIEPIPFLTPYFQITRSFNTGAAFGFLPEASDIFLIIAIVVIIGLFFFYPRIPDKAHITRFSTGLVAGGALGNAVDRLTYEHVVDFIHYQIPDVISNVSNIADHAIVFGVLLIFFENWRLESLEKQREAQAALATDGNTVTDNNMPESTPINTPQNTEESAS